MCVCVVRVCVRACVQVFRQFSACVTSAAFLGPIRAALVEHAVKSLDIRNDSELMHIVNVMMSRVSSRFVQALVNDRRRTLEVKLNVASANAVATAGPLADAPKAIVR